MPSWFGFESFGEPHFSETYVIPTNPLEAPSVWILQSTFHSPEMPPATNDQHFLRQCYFATRLHIVEMLQAGPCSEFRCRNTDPTGKAPKVLPVREAHTEESNLLEWVLLQPEATEKLP